MNTPGIKIHTITTYELAKALENFIPGIWTKSQVMPVLDAPLIRMEIWKHLVSDDIYMCPMRKDFPDISSIGTCGDLERFKQ